LLFSMPSANLTLISFTSCPNVRFLPYLADLKADFFHTLTVYFFAGNNSICPFFFGRFAVQISGNDQIIQGFSHFR